MQKGKICLSLLAAAVSIALLQPDASAQKTKEEALAAAKDKNANRTYRSTPEGEGALTPEMIERCIRLNMEVDASYAAIGKAKEEFDTLNKELNDLSEKLTTAKDEVDRSGTAARQDYDTKVQYYNARLPELDKQLEVYKTMVKTYQSKSDKFDRECNGQPYYEDDYADMVKKLGRGM